ncbi:hypothetical protein [Egicoccus halophilus]|uniref:Uncharacterized protein n=1 Tax=Egicoccus halophilus TaxID=1670830 RepID=A0A8J3ERT6_9ACTN|nr:hypothetical protein [Egicoccus halophilus]GGI05683.1 hypothetical protein GCM10011354_15310 [Egicoccus halophilus]
MNQLFSSLLPLLDGPLVAVEQAIPSTHPAAWLAVPLGLLFFGGSVYALLWSNYGARKAGAIYGVAFFGFGLLIGVFWWFGGPGIPPYLGITHLPGQNNAHYAENWFAFEPGAERGEFFAPEQAEFVSVEQYLGLEGQDEEEILADPAYASLSGSVNAAVEQMQDQFLPIDGNGVAQIGVERRSALEEEVAEVQPEDSRRANPFYTADVVGEPRIADDPETGLRLLTAEFQTFANFVDDDGVPVTDPIAVGEPGAWYSFFDPGMRWLPSALWTIVSLLGFLASLFWLDRLEMREKRLLADQVEEPEDLAVPIAQ